MCIMCHLAATPVGQENPEKLLLQYSTYPMVGQSGVILPYNGSGNKIDYTFDHDGTGVIDAQYYQLPGDLFDYSWTF